MSLKPIPRVTRTTLRVLNALAQGDTYGYMISSRTGLQSGSVAPILKRLEGLGWVQSGWEATQPEGRPRRRYYRLTPEAQPRVSSLLRERLKEAS